MSDRDLLHEKVKQPLHVFPVPAVQEHWYGPHECQAPNCGSESGSYYEFYFLFAPEAHKIWNEDEPIKRDEVEVQGGRLAGPLVLCEHCWETAWGAVQHWYKHDHLEGSE